jgi:hypothetical protein
MQGKMQELVGLFKKGTADERNRAITLLQELDVINAQFYKQQLK